MSIQIHIIGANYHSHKTDEQDAAKCLKKRFEEDLKTFQHSKGDIYILPSVFLFGQKRRDIDLLVMGFIEGLTVNDTFYAKTSSNNNIKINSLDIQSFMVNVELKSHSVDKITHLGNGHYKVQYPSTNTTEDASEQVFEALHSLRKHLNFQLGISPFVSDVLWFKSVSSAELNSLRGATFDNALPNEFSFKDFISTILLSANVYYHSGSYHLNSFPDGQKSVDAIKKLFTTKREAKGLTKKKFELLSAQSLGDMSKIAQSAGKQLTITTGRAGTGKTIQLLQLAFYLANENNNKRCLILTYNRALVSDIQRLIDYTPMPSKIDGRTVRIRTINSFFHSLMESTGAVAEKLNPNDPNYENKYVEGLNSLKEFVGSECEENGVEALKEVADQFIDWDYIFIDEAQDCQDIEKEVLFMVYGPQRLIIADGVDQFVNGNDKQVWDDGIKDKVYKPKEMDLERRQKTNLVRFANAYAELADIGWKVRPNEEIPGGSIKIYSHYTDEIHKELCKSCKDNECENYDILILEPPCMIEKDTNGAHFKLANAYEEVGIKLYDGTNYNNRTNYPTKDECRLYQYHSCRGLEGWCVVCDGLDLLYDHLVDNWKPTGNELGFDQEKTKERFAMLWTMMPLTRPIDTLVITLKNPDSKVGKLLKTLSIQHKDYVEWHIK